MQRFIPGVDKDRAIFEIKRAKTIEDPREVCWLEGSDVNRMKQFMEQYEVTGLVHSQKAETSLCMQALSRNDILDHIMCFRCRSGNIITSQPYVERNRMVLKCAQEWADERSMSVEEKPELSWHNPGETTLLIFSDKGENQTVF